MSEAKLDRELRKFNSKRIDKIDSIDVYKVSVPVKREKTTVASLKNNKYIKFAELDVLVPPAYIANDTYFNSAWHLSKLNVPASWDISEGAGITVAISDTGVRVTHADLSANISTIKGYNFYDNNTDITDIHGHGTAVAGTVAAVTNNGIGVSSMAGKSKILPIRIAAPDGYASYSAMASAITYAADNGARVLNCSYGGGGNSSSIQSAATYMVSKGGVVVWAAGNDNADYGFYDNPNIILVSATNKSDVRTSWSSFGAYVDVAAPGEGVYTTVYTSDTAYGIANGTSFSSPIVAGIVAQMLSINPALQMKDVDFLLKSTAVDLGDPGEDIYYGAGRVDAYAAVSAAKNYVVSDTTNPIVKVNLTAGTVLRGDYPVSVTASDNVGVSRVELYLSNILVATDTSTPYDFILDSTKFTNGTYTLTAKAYDIAGNSATNSVQVYVSNNDLIPPVVKFVNPINGSIIPKGNKPVKVVTNATDNSGTAVIQKLYINNALVYTVTGGTLTYNWKPNPGIYTLMIEATDTAQNSAATTITVTKQ